MKIINAGVTAPKGFKCAGLRAGVKPGKTNKDMAMIVSEVPAKIAGTFTKNIVKAAPVLWGKKIVEEQEAVREVVINTGIANACTGAQGYENVVTEAKEVAKLLDIKPEEVVVGSTGVIGQQLPMDVIKEGIKKLVPELKADRQSEEDASWAILTTDTKPKEAAVEVEINGKTVTIAGMCKGSGMIHPNMGTMLGFITTDAAIDKAIYPAIKDGNNPIPITPSVVNALGSVILDNSVTFSPPIKLPIAISNPDATTKGNM